MTTPLPAPVPLAFFALLVLTLGVGCSVGPGQEVLVPEEVEFYPVYCDSDADGRPSPEELGFFLNVRAVRVSDERGVLLLVLVPDLEVAQELVGRLAGARCGFVISRARVDRAQPGRSLRASWEEVVFVQIDEVGWDRDFSQALNDIQQWKVRIEQLQARRNHEASSPAESPDSGCTLP